MKRVYKLQAISSGSSRDRIGGPIKSAHINVGIYHVKEASHNAKSQRESLVRNERWSFVQGKGWSMSDWSGKETVSLVELVGPDFRSVEVTLDDLLFKPEIVVEKHYGGMEGTRALVVVVDAQNDFISKDVLGSDDSDSIAKSIVGFCRDVASVGSARPSFLFTRDTHDGDYLESREGKTLPVVHCVRGTAGWSLFNGLSSSVGKCNSKTLDKSTFMAKAKDMKSMLKGLVAKATGESVQDLDLEACTVPVFVCGFCTSICVASNALLIRTLMPETQVYVVEDLCGDIDTEHHNAGILTMRANHVTALGKAEAAAIIKEL